MFCLDLLINKIFALALVSIGVLTMRLDGDATMFILALFFAAPMFFAKRSWIK